MMSLSPEAIAVIEGRHADPFCYLGPHVDNGHGVLRVPLPAAYGGSNSGAVISSKDEGRHNLRLVVPPLAAIFLVRES